MTPRARTRLVSVIVVLAGLGLALGLALYGLSGKITYFQTPSDIAGGALAARTGAPEGTVCSRFRYGLARLRQLLEERS